MKVAFPMALAAAASLTAGPASGAESKPFAAEGVERVQLVTDREEIAPGESLYIALILDPEPGFHTYWKGPGIVGVATSIDWVLPEGFRAGELLWPPPVETDMAGIRAHGYKGETWLLTKIQTPETLEGDSVAIEAHVAWMACSTSCHPGVTDLRFALPVNRTAEPSRFDENRHEKIQSVLRSVPGPAPEDWSVVPRLVTPSEIVLEATLPHLENPEQLGEIHFFCHDMQVDSDEPQQTEFPADAAVTFRQHLARPSFAPKSPASISGLLHCPGGWPGVGSRWVEIALPWPPGTFSDE